MPVLNEAAHIENTLRSLLDMEPPSGCTLKFLLVDGGSSDGTREIISEFADEIPVIRLLENPRRTTPAALNIGIAAARGEYVCILGGHAKYPPNYVRTCWEEMHAHGAVACSGTLLTSPAGTALGARLAAWCMGHRFASSRRSVRTNQGGFAQTIPYPVMRKSVLIEAGGYDERLERNQDNDMNQRLCTRGHKLYLSARTRAEYYAPAGVGSLLRYAFRTGKWNAITLRYRPAAMSLRHFAPLALVGALAASALSALGLAMFGSPTKLALWVTAALLGSHIMLASIAGVETALHERKFAPLLLPPVILAFHLAYGAGTVGALLTHNELHLAHPELHRTASFIGKQGDSSKVPDLPTGV